MATVSVAVAALLLEIVTGLVVPKLRVGGSTAPVGLAVTLALSVTLPTKAFAGVTVMVEVLPEVAPGVTVVAVPAKEKPGGGVIV